MDDKFYTGFRSELAKLAAYVPELEGAEAPLPTRGDVKAMQKLKVRQFKELPKAMRTGPGAVKPQKGFVQSSAKTRMAEMKPKARRTLERWYKGRGTVKGLGERPALAGLAKREREEAGVRKFIAPYLKAKAVRRRDPKQLRVATKAEQKELKKSREAFDAAREKIKGVSRVDPLAVRGPQMQRWSYIAGEPKKLPQVIRWAMRAAKPSSAKAKAVERAKQLAKAKPQGAGHF